jgi:hypothetical protein
MSLTGVSIRHLLVIVGVACALSCSPEGGRLPERGRYIWQSEHGMVVLDLLENREYAIPSHGAGAATHGFYTIRADTLFLSQAKGPSMPLLVRGDSLVLAGVPEMAYVKER